MRRGTEQRTVRSFCKRKPKINIRPDYQRGAVWSKPQKELYMQHIVIVFGLLMTLWFSTGCNTVDRQQLRNPQRSQTSVPLETTPVKNQFVLEIGARDSQEPSRVFFLVQEAASDAQDPFRRLRWHAQTGSTPKLEVHLIRLAEKPIQDKKSQKSQGALYVLPLPERPPCDLYMPAGWYIAKICDSGANHYPLSDEIYFVVK